MSWAEEDWTVGLSGRVQQKVKELQVQQERLSRENKQKQLQLDNIHASHEKQTVKYEEVRAELQSMQRELQSVRDESKTAVTSRDRLTQELQTKQAQVCSLEGQLDSARTLNSKLAHEIKRLEAELEKLQNSYKSADTTVFSTPYWNTPSSWEHNGSRKEERPGQRDEGQSPALHIRQRLQFSDMPTASLPRQQHKSTPHSESFSTPLSAFPWERDESRPAARRPSPSSPQTPLTHLISQGQSEQGVWEQDPRTETDKSLSEIRSHVSSLEEQLSVKDSMLNTTQGELVQCKKDLATKELNLQKTHTRIAQESERASGAEQRLKQVQEELKCQRQNAESSRLQHQQRIKELEKQNQRDLIEFQKERQCLEKQHQQEMNKLNQELQQARTLHNALQAQADKLSLQKQAMEKELDTMKEKLMWTEKQLQETLKKEAQTQAKLTEAVREVEGVAVSLEQSKKRERALEEEGRRLAEERADALRLLKEMQEQKPAPPLQPVQICSVGQSFSPQPSYSVHSRLSTHTKRPIAAPQAEWKREEEENVDDRRVEISASYPSDREPGEGMDSEHITVHISPDSESLLKGEHRRKCYEDENKSRNEMIECDSSGTAQHYKFDHVTSKSSHSVAGTPTNTSIDDQCSLKLSAEKTPSLVSDQAKASDDFKRENAMLRSELHDLREELQKRLEDLEVQRRAEAEARTRLKQLSRKRAAQTVEKEEHDRVWRVQLESERAETEKLRKAMAGLQTELKRNRVEIEKKEREGQEVERNKALEERESEMIELNIQLKKQLAEVKAQLALEREERNREEEERHQMTVKDIDLKKEFSMKMAELKAELEEVKRSRKEDLLENDKVSVANSPLTYLTLHDDEFNSNIVHCDDSKRVPSPEQHLLLCQFTNQCNTLVSQATSELIQEHQTVTYPENSPLSGEGPSGHMTSALKDKRQNCLEGFSLSEQVELAHSDLAKEVERLQKENEKETQRANQYQVKLEALQSQVTRQTQQLTMAFEKQSQHISGLLAELQEKESALLSQGEELQHFKHALDALKAEKEQEEREKTEEMMVKSQKIDIQDERLLEISRLQPNQEKECAITLVDDDLNAQRQMDEPKTVTSPTAVSSEEASEALSLGEQHSGFVDSDKTQSNYDSTCVTGETEWSQDGGTVELVAELLALQQENQLLKQRMETLMVSDISKPALQAISKNQEVTVKQSQNIGNALSCLLNERMEGEEEENKRTKGADEEHEDVSQLQINHLEQQVVALQMKVRALSEQTQQQGEELTVWRLASQPAPTFDQILSNTDNQSETQDQISAVTHSQSNQQNTDDKNQAEKQPLDPQGGPGKMTVTREDELFLSCSSNKLQGRMLFSRLQHINLPEPKILYPSKKTSALQQYSQDTGNIDKESEKENQETSVLQQSDTSPPQYTVKTDINLIQMLSENVDQHHVTKDVLKVSGSCKTKPTEFQTVNCEANPDTSRQTNETSATNDSSNRDFSTEMKSVSSQTEDSLYPHSAPAASELNCAYTQTEEDKEDKKVVDSSSVPLSQTSEPGDKLMFSGSFPIPADPARLAERIRRNRTQLSAAFDDTEYEPYGLPEVVMKGFADIPSGPSCPYIVRRGLLGTTVVPASQNDPGQEETD